MTNDLDPDRVSADAHLPSLLSDLDDLAQWQRHLNATLDTFRLTAPTAIFDGIARSQGHTNVHKSPYKSGNCKKWLPNDFDMQQCPKTRETWRCSFCKMQAFQQILPVLRLKPVGNEFAYCRHRERFAVDIPIELGEAFPDCPRSKSTSSNLLKLFCDFERLFCDPSVPWIFGAAYR